MARKFCPACNALKGASATRCDCGHVFESASIVAPQEPKTCPYCGARNPSSAQTCDCGGHFDLDPREARALIAGRRTNGALQLIAGLSLLAGEIALFVASGFVSIWLLLGPAFRVSNGLRRFLGAGQDLREHDAKPQLPEAKLQR